MAGEGVFPKSPGDILYSSEVNAFNTQSKNKTSYWTCDGRNFHVKDQADDYTYESNKGALTVGTDSTYCLASVNLPQGAVVTAVICYGNISDESWTFERTRLSTGSTSVMAVANINTEDTTITNATVNNPFYAYSMRCNLLDNTDEIWGVRITYTTDYI